MTDTQTTIIVAAIAPTIVALTGLIVGILNSRKASATREVVEVNDAKTDTIIEKATELHVLANGNLSKTTSALEVANTKIEGLQKMVAQLVEARGVADRLATDKSPALTDAPIQVVAPPGVPLQTQDVTAPVKPKPRNKP